MVSSLEIVRKVQQAVSPEDWKVIESSIAEINQGEGRRAQKTLEKDIYILITNYAFKNNKPELLLALSGFANNDIDRLFSQIILKYIITQDEKWLKTVFPLSETLGKKSYQSRIFAMMAKTLIEAGVSKANAGFITSGMILLERISFRKYRSDVMVDIIPLLIECAVITRDEKLLIRSHLLSEEINDISKEPRINAELAQALASIAILEKNRYFLLTVSIVLRGYTKRFEGRLVSHLSLKREPYSSLERIYWILNSLSKISMIFRKKDSSEIVGAHDRTVIGAGEGEVSDYHYSSDSLRKDAFCIR